MNNVRASFPRFTGLLLAGLLAAGTAIAAPDDDFMAAREAFRVGNGAKLAEFARKLKGYPLEPYVQFWQLRLRLEDASPDEVQSVLAATRDGPVSDQLRTDWLKVLGKRQDWAAYAAEYPKLASTDNTELACYALQAGLGPATLDEWQARVRQLWFTGRDLPDSCAPLLDTLKAQEALQREDVWLRVRLALEAGNTGVAMRAAQYLPEGHGLDARQLTAIAANPQQFLDGKQLNLRSRGGREMALFAVQRLARTSPQLAAERLEKLGPQLSESERAYGWGMVASLGAQRLDPNAAAWYKRAGELNDQQLGWKVRTALRQQRWPDVLAAIEAMSAKEQQEPAWRYWKARALRQQGRVEEARAVFVPLSTEYNFYGQLALEELGGKVSVPMRPYTPRAEEVKAIAGVAALQRAQVFYRLNLRFEGNREWSWAIRDMDDKQLLAAAEYARRLELWDRAINTADRTKEMHDFTMRYLAPYREQAKDFVARERLDEAFVYGLIRQESRFIAGAKSSVGAAGLMQLMPSTAKWVASKMGLKDWRWSTVNDVDTNLSLGTWYLKHVLDSLDSHPVLATAAYNAGPGRARAWRADQPMEAAIYAESIPFNETRDYVKRVMANASYYAALFTQQAQSLKGRIGTVMPKGTKEQPLPVDEP
jgi:soluble lytic murein transglycosylase